MGGYQQYMYNSSSAMEESCDRRASWYPRPLTYQVNAHAANVAVLPNQAPLYRPKSQWDSICWVKIHVSLHGQWGEQSYTEPLDTVTDISIRVINPRKKRDAKIFILKDIHPQTIQTLS